MQRAKTQLSSADRSANVVVVSEKASQMEKQLFPHVNSDLSAIMGAEYMYLFT